MDYELGVGFHFPTIHGEARNVRFTNGLLMWSVNNTHYMWNPLVYALSVQHPTGDWMQVSMPTEDFADTMINPLFAMLQVPNHEELTYGTSSSINQNTIDPTTWTDEATTSGTFHLDRVGTRPGPNIAATIVEGLPERPVSTNNTSFVSESWVARNPIDKQPITEYYPREVS